MKPIVRITRKAIPVAEVLRSVADESAGGTVFFLGTVRNESRGSKVTGLELESAPGLAKKDLERIAKAAAERREIARIAIWHRTGRLRVGDPIVAIAVSASHRKAAFGACRFIIDSLKRTTPIWKKELGEMGSRWVEGG